jgi:sigma-B regulation protein RsbU (phosphoserine phosphatase)
MDLPVVFQYQQALDAFRRAGEASPLMKRMSELISLLDLTTTLSSSLSREEILDAALLIVLGELQARRGCLLVQDGPDVFRMRAARGMPPEAPPAVTLPGLSVEGVLTRDAGQHADAFAALGIDILCPVVKNGRVIAVLGLGRRADDRPFGPEEQGFLRSVAACAATPIENGLIYGELKQVNQRLSLKVFQLHNLFDVSRELTSCYDEESILQLVTTTLMGQLMVSRCALLMRTAEGLVVAEERGTPWTRDMRLPVSDADTVLATLRAPLSVTELPEGALRERLTAARLVLVVPLTAGDRVAGFLAAGERLSGAGFDAEDREFAQTLARQALAALESVRLTRMRVERQRQDREMQIARDIQQSLFPRERPHVPGFAVAASSESCYHVGGDHYDFIPIEGGRLALAIADVSGKGAPASILMASVHASLRALAGSAPPERMLLRLNRFLFDSTQANRYVTMFYAELDPATRALTYVNAGHVPPYLVRAEGVERLTSGGTVVGLIEDATYEHGVVQLEDGDVVAMVTDGVTEAASPQEEEYGDERLVAALRGGRDGSADDVLRGLLESVRAFVGSAGCVDDQTALVLKALPS